jgi:hypothetical protein
MKSSNCGQPPACCRDGPNHILRALLNEQQRQKCGSGEAEQVSSPLECSLIFHL